MANLNKVLLIGRLTRDPELRYTPSGTPVADFGLAVNRQSTDSSGEKKETTCFVDIVAWSKQAEVIHRYMKKGRQIFIEGRLDFSQWEDKDGQKRSRLKVVLEGFQFLDSSGGRRGEESAPGAEPLVDEPLGAGPAGARPSHAPRYPSPRPSGPATTSDPGAGPSDLEPPAAGDDYNLGDPPF
jgi:single-strand DNA-binding protein